MFAMWPSGSQEDDLLSRFFPPQPPQHTQSGFTHDGVQYSVNSTSYMTPIFSFSAVSSSSPGNSNPLRTQTSSSQTPASAPGGLFGTALHLLDGIIGMNNNSTHRAGRGGLPRYWGEDDGDRARRPQVSANSSRRPSYAGAAVPQPPPPTQDRPRTSRRNSSYMTDEPSRTRARPRAVSPGQRYSDDNDSQSIKLDLDDAEAEVSRLKREIDTRRKNVDTSKSRVRRAARDRRVPDDEYAYLKDRLYRHETALKEATRSLEEARRERNELLDRFDAARAREARRERERPTPSSRSRTARFQAFEEDYDNDDDDSSEHFRSTPRRNESGPRPTRRHTATAATDDIASSDPFAFFFNRSNTDPLAQAFDDLRRTGNFERSGTTSNGGRFRFHAHFGTAGGNSNTNADPFANAHSMFNDPFDDIFRMFNNSSSGGTPFSRRGPFGSSNTNNGRTPGSDSRSRPFHNTTTANEPLFPSTPKQPSSTPPTTLLTPTEAASLYTTYNTRWLALAPSDPAIPFPSRGLSPTALSSHTTLWAPNISTPVAEWTKEDIMQANVMAFFLGAAGIMLKFEEVNGKVTMGFDKRVAGEEKVKVLGEMCKREKTRWHSDRLGRRNGGGEGVNETLKGMEESKAVWNAVCEIMEVVVAK